MGAVATWYAWDEYARLQRIERHGIQTVATIAGMRAAESFVGSTHSASRQVVDLRWRDSSGPRRLHDVEISSSLASRLLAAAPARRELEITFLPGAVNTLPVATHDLPELRADALHAVRLFAACTLLCAGLLAWIRLTRRRERLRRSDTGATVLPARGHVRQSRA